MKGWIQLSRAADGKRCLVQVAQITVVIGTEPEDDDDPSEHTNVYLATTAEDCLTVLEPPDEVELAIRDAIRDAG